MISSLFWVLLEEFLLMVGVTRTCTDEFLDLGRQIPRSLVLREGLEDHLPLLEKRTRRAQQTVLLLTQLP